MSDGEGRVFEITSPSGRIELDRQRKGEVLFTVTSTRGPIRARALVVPEGSAKEEWFTLEGPAERNFEGTEQFRVGVAIPAGVPSDSYSFHLKVVSEANPDDDFTDGPRAAFDVAPSEAPAKFPWWIVAVVAGVLVLGGVLAYVLWPKEAGLLEDCAGRECAEALTCVEREGEEICVGALRYVGCRDDGDCGMDLSCQVTGDADDVDAEAASGGTCLGALGYRPCGERDCGLGLACDREAAGEPTCRGGDGFAGCDADRPCASGFDCVSFFTDTPRCLRRLGVACGRNDQCVSLLCNEESHTCTKQANNQPCDHDVQCRSNICSQSTHRCSAPPSPCSPACRFFERCVGGHCRPFTVRPEVFQPGGVIHHAPGIRPDSLRRDPGR